MKFVHLHVHSHYSLLDGLPKIEELVLKAKELGMDALALTDHGFLYGAVDFYKTAKAHGVKPIIGLEIYVAARKMTDRQPGFDDKRFHLTLLAKNNHGYKNLIKLTTIANLEGFYYKPRLDHETIKKYSDGIIALSGCMSGEIPRAIAARNYELAEELIVKYKDIFKSDFYLELMHLPGIKVRDEINNKLIEYSKKFGVEPVAACDVHYLEKEDAKFQQTLMSVQTGAKLGEGDGMTLAQDDFSFKGAEEMWQTFPYSKEALENTVKIAEQCDVELELGKIQLPYFTVPTEETPDSYLRKLCLEKMQNRYAAQEIPAAKERLDYELSVVEKTGFASYFLIVQDFVNWAKENKIMVGPGRGSAAGSIVSYILNITNVDPIAYNLLFERFLNPERISMPDIDLDFADTGRDRVLEYVTKKYGINRVAQIITFGTMAARAAVRDAGRALGIHYEFCDRLAKLIPFGSSLNDALESAHELRELYQNNKDAKKIIDTAKKLEGVARHASVHACGVVISKNPLDETVPLQYATRSQDDVNGQQAAGKTAVPENRKQIVTQYEMHAIEDLGLLKMDFLGLKNLSIIENTVNLIEKRHSKRVKIEKIPFDDEKTFNLLQEAKTTGVFQLESAGMKRYLKDLRPTNLEDIIVMVSLYRPGPLDAGMVEEYIARKHGQKKVVYLHPMLEPILKNTYGIIVYQEQLMQLANSLAGFSLPQGYVLIKAVGKKIKKLLDEQREKLINGMVKNSISRQTAEKIWDFIEPFARYGFNRSHAACYAIIGYQTAFLKAHFPAEFMASLMTSDLADIERVAFLIEEAKELGIKTLPPTVNASSKTFTVISDSDIRFGLAAIKNVGENVVEAIIETREDNPFSSIEDFLNRVKHKDLNKKSFESLIKSGALDELGERNQLLANLDTLLEYSKQMQKNAQSSQIGLFESSPVKIGSLRLASAEPAAQSQKLSWEKELLGLYLSSHPLIEHKEKLVKQTTPIANITNGHIGRVIKVGGLVSGIKPIVAKNGASMAFASLQDSSGKIELVIFPDNWEKTKSKLKDQSVVLISGRVDSRNGSYKIICNDIKIMG